MLRALFLVLFTSLSGLANAENADTAKESGNLWHCLDNTASTPCQNNAIASGFELPPEGNYLNSRRLAGVGNILKEDGSTKVQLIAIGYRWSSNFHKKIHFPNKICAFFVSPNNEKQKRIIQQAISAFENGDIPLSNSAYQFAMEHEWRKDDCMAVEADAGQRFLVSGSKEFKLAQKEGRLYFYAANWSDNGTLFFRSGR